MLCSATACLLLSTNDSSSHWEREQKDGGNLPEIHHLQSPAGARIQKKLAKICKAWQHWPQWQASKASGPQWLLTGEIPPVKVLGQTNCGWFPWFLCSGSTVHNSSSSRQFSIVLCTVSVTKMSRDTCWTKRSGPNSVLRIGKQSISESPLIPGCRSCRPFGGLPWGCLYQRLQLCKEEVYGMQTFHLGLVFFLTGNLYHSSSQSQHGSPSKHLHLSEHGLLWQHGLPEPGPDWHWRSHQKVSVDNRSGSWKWFEMAESSSWSQVLEWWQD